MSLVVPKTLKSEIMLKTEHLIKSVQQHYSTTLKNPTIGFRRSGRNAGTAHLLRNHINFNPNFLLGNIDEFLNHVVPHEVAHIVVYQIYGKVKPHGKEWQFVMETIFDCPATVTHTMTSKLPVNKTFSYRCDCGVIELSIRRHNKVVKGHQSYRCVKCLSTLIPAELET